MNEKPVKAPVNGPAGVERSGVSAVARADSLVAHNYRLGRRNTLHRNQQFQYVYRRGKSSGCTHFTLIYLPGRQLRLGISVSRKVGCAVTRNRIRRLLRENIRLMQHDIKPGQYVLIARPAAAKADYHTLGRSLRYVLRREGLLQEV
ncbi:MAG: ribonuclease P protein component [Candidatus Fimadaptatus sp.]|jgi:ribonuclease P protein component